MKRGDKDLTNVMRGSTPINRVMRGGTLIWERGPALPTWEAGLQMDGTFSIYLTGTGEVDWGDGSARTPYDGAFIEYTHDYTAFDGTISFYGSLILFENSTDGSVMNYDVSSLPNGITHFTDGGDNTAYGDIETIPTSLLYIEIQGANVVSGILDNIHEGIDEIRITGLNTMSGDIGNAPRSSTTLRIFGQNTITGDIATMPPNNTHFYISGDCTIYGNLADVPSWGSIFSVKGNGIVEGDLTDIDTAVHYFSLTPNSHLSDYSGSIVISPEMYHLELVTEDGYGLDTAELDQLLIDLDDANFGEEQGSDEIIIGGGCSPRSSVSDDAVANLEARGIVVDVPIQSLTLFEMVIVGRDDPDTACLLSDYDELYHDGDFDVPAVGDHIFLNDDGSSPFDGRDLFFRDHGTPTTYAMQIDTSGEVTYRTACNNATIH